MNSIREEFEKHVKNPHDAMVKVAFRKIELARSFFRKYLPRRIAELLDLDILEIRNGSYVDEKLRDRHSDIVYGTRIKKTEAFLYLLFEHQSAPDRFFVFRLLCYIVNLWREYLDQNPKAKTLPVVIPLLLYHGKEKWNAPDRMWKLLDGGENFREYVPDFSFELYSLADYEDESLLVGDFMALGVVLYLMKHIFDRDFGEVFVKAMKYLANIRDKRTQLEFLELALRYAYHARNDEKAAVHNYIERGIEQINEKDARRLAMSVAEQIRQEGIKKGQIGIFLKMIKRRFGHVPPGLDEKLGNADIGVLDEFGDSLLDSDFKDLKDVEKWLDEN